MAVPKRKHSKARTRKKRFEKMKMAIVNVIKTGAKTFKRPHFDENLEI